MGKKDKKYLFEQAYFHSDSGTETKLIVDLGYKRVTVAIIPTDSMPRLTVKRFWRQGNAYRYYLYELGVVLRGCWAFDRFSWQSKVTGNKEGKTSTKSNGE